MQYITEYNPDWPNRYDAIASSLRSFLPKDCRLHHVGSTSVPGMPAKDIIDIDIECPTGAMKNVISRLQNVGYQHEGDKGIQGREAFCPLANSIPSRLPAHHLYACETDSRELKKHLAFREYLIAHPNRAEWLAEQKIEADKMAKDRDSYIEGKSRFYEIITTESLKWHGFIE